MTLLEIFRFEIIYRLRRPETYLFFIILLLVSLVGVDFIFAGVDLGPVKENAPIVISKTMGVITGLFMMIASFIMGVPVLRDFQYKVQSFILSNPIRKLDYLLGKFLGSFLILLLIFSGQVLGLILGEYMPWRNAEVLLPTDLAHYIYAFVTISLPILFFGSAVFFVSGALSRNLMIVYTQGIFFFVIFVLNKSIKNEFLQGILDPFSLSTLTQMTEHWSGAKRNESWIPFAGVLLYNKLFWVSTGVVALLFLLYQFRFEMLSFRKRKNDRKLLKDIPSSSVTMSLPKVHFEINRKAEWLQLMHKSTFYFKLIVKSASFWSIVACAFIIIGINSISLATLYGVDSLPTTYYIIGELQEMSIYFFAIILVFYSGEIIWRERDLRIDQISDAMPYSRWIDVVGKFLGLTYIYIILLISLIVAGIVFQISKGYYRLDLWVYFAEFFGNILPYIMIYTAASFFIHALVNHKYLSYLLTFLFFIITAALQVLGYNHDLIAFGGGSLAPYSDMNGYGHSIRPFLWSKIYWLAIMSVILLITTGIQVRGSERRLSKRLQIAKSIVLGQYKLAIGVLTMIILIAGSVILYNTNVLNDYWSTDRQYNFRADYERALKQYEHLPQPRITQVNLDIESFTYLRSYEIDGMYTLTNHTYDTIHHIHIQKKLQNALTFDSIKLSSEATLDDRYLEFGHYIYRLDKPLLPSDSLSLQFRQVYRSRGFDGDYDSNIAYNGTIITHDDLPGIGYEVKYEIEDPSDRNKYGLEPRKNSAELYDIEVLRNSANEDAHLITFDCTIGTPIDQVAIAPGKRTLSWTSEGRKYVKYSAKDPMILYYPIAIGEYKVQHDVYISNDDSTTLEIFYDPKHAHNLNRMMESMKASLNYYEENFAPYKMQDLRIVEMPRYHDYAQSLAGTIMYSEGMGFVLDIEEEDVDMVHFVTAHEIAHQWWGMQLMAANVAGNKFILESLAQYSALMVLRETYGEEKVSQLLATFNKRYIQKRNGAEGAEPPLVEETGQSFLYYDKGAIQLFAAQSLIGEKSMNKAIQNFYSEWNNEAVLGKSRYATSYDLVNHLMEATPDSLQKTIKSLFYDVKIHDLQLNNVETKQIVNDSTELSLNISAQAYIIDENGEEQPIEMERDVEIGIWIKEGEKQQFYIENVRVDQKNIELRFAMKGIPYKVIIDPRNLFLEKDKDDNVKEVR